MEISRRKWRMESEVKAWEYYTYCGWESMKVHDEQSYAGLPKLFDEDKEMVAESNFESLWSNFLS